jgi:hypothetical protein
VERSNLIEDLDEDSFLVSAFSLSAFQFFSFSPNTFPFPLSPLQRIMARLFVMGGTFAQSPLRLATPSGRHAPTHPASTLSLPHP